jgi:ectoine hydroxylase-related dioxygenase (phytanoyl-CoA dioxygenase family)
MAATPSTPSNPTTSPPLLLAGERVEAFRRDGYVVVPDLLDPDELARFGELVSRAVHERVAGDRRRLADKSRYEQSFVQCQNLWEDHPEVRPLSFHPRLGQAAAELLGVERVRLWHDQALYKEPGGRGTDAHQDQPYWPIEEPLTVTAWVPFEGSTLDGGAMGYVPGSHRTGLRRFVNIFRGEPDDLLASPELAGSEPVFVEVPVGGVAFHHGLTAHLARPNRTDRARAVHTVIYLADGCHRAAEHHHPAVDRPGIPPGELIASDVTPIAWPRPAGDLPGTPTEPWPTDPFVPGLHPIPR